MVPKHRRLSIPKTPVAKSSRSEYKQRQVALKTKAASTWDSGYRSSQKSSKDGPAVAEPMLKTGEKNFRRSYNGPALQSLVKQGSQERSSKGPKGMISVGSSNDLYAE